MEYLRQIQRAQLVNSTWYYLISWWDDDKLTTSISKLQSEWVNSWSHPQKRLPPSHIFSLQIWAEEISMEKQLKANLLYLPDISNVIFQWFRSREILEVKINLTLQFFSTFLQIDFFGTTRVFISTHNFLTILSQCEKNSAHIVTQNIRWHWNSSRNLFTFCYIFSRKEGILL